MNTERTCDVGRYHDKEKGSHQIKKCASEKKTNNKTWKGKDQTSTGAYGRTLMINKINSANK